MANYAKERLEISLFSISGSPLTHCIKGSMIKSLPTNNFSGVPSPAPLPLLPCLIIVYYNILKIRYPVSKSTVGNRRTFSRGFFCYLSPHPPNNNNNNKNRSSDPFQGILFVIWFGFGKGMNGNKLLFFCKE